MCNYAKPGDWDLGFSTADEYCDYYGEPYINEENELERVPLDTTSFPADVKIEGVLEGAFYHCKKLESVVIPKNIWMGFEGRAFAYCEKLSSIVVEEGNPYFDSRDNCNAIIYTPDNELLEGCKNTKIPSSVVCIQTDAFMGCIGLETIVVPEGVQKIHHKAFANCKDLKSIDLPNSISIIDKTVFDGCDALETIYIPAGTKQKFESLIPEYKDKLKYKD